VAYGKDRICSDAALFMDYVRASVAARFSTKSDHFLRCRVTARGYVFQGRLITKTPKVDGVSCDDEIKAVDLHSTTPADVSDCSIHGNLFRIGFEHGIWKRGNVG
jgi:hypothetical protein